MKTINSVAKPSRHTIKRQTYVHQLMHERDYSNAVVDCLPGVFYLVDKFGNMLRWNRNMEVVSGYSREEIAHMHAYDFVRSDDRQRAIRTREEVLKDGDYHEGETEFVTKSGQHIPYFFDARRVSFEGEPCVMGVGVDITNVKQAEYELERVNEVLEARVRERTKELEESYKELETFSYTVSHDLRAPLQAIRGFAEMLEEDYRAQLRGEGEDLLHRILQADERMTRLVNDVLRYARMGRTAITLEPVPLSQLIRYVRTEFELRLKEIGGRINVADGLPSVKGDLTLLAQVFANLFQNAINYRRIDVPLAVNVSSRREGDNVIILVEDNGIGIPTEHHEKVFQAFMRLHGNRQIPGNGLGLATVKKAVETMHGEIWIQSEPGKGTTFCIQLNAAD